MATLRDQTYNAEWFAEEFRRLVAKAHDNGVYVTAKGKLYVFKDGDKFEIDVVRRTHETAATISATKDLR